MIVTNIILARLLRYSKFWLLGIVTILIVIYISLLLRIGDIAHLGMSALFLITVASLVWEKRHSLHLKSEIFSSIVGALLIVFFFGKSVPLIHSNLVRALPFIAAVGLSLIASGFKGLKQYLQELTILFFLGIPSIVLPSLIDISPVTAKFAAFLLWYLGFDVARQGVYISLPTGVIEVYGGCSGMESMTYLLGVSVICLVIFPISTSKQLFVPITAVILGFVVNAFRVALMVILIASGHHQAFDYWHKGDGSHIFGIISLLIFGLFCLFIIQQSRTKNQNTHEY
ncbi:cyanoexosortase A [Chlorogloeopsis sp. ULAP01]|uniref:cyanoexosortase A n=1 Tax=Chlorogloeopsis sp. ULAP01 TaxID=3056483 RepID=UPI0025AB3E70|nr:cyanoexosortase A [Chlorogloeopsis sp. ULAP01]MDM9379967.1 cyanoexosortase A [Chlorogloeopsis sp. ULAP01]